jgi:di/tricarboxylate transporter
MESSLTLTPDMITVLALLSLVIVLFLTEWVRVDLAALTILVLLGLTGLIPSRQLFNGFASNAVISIIAVMIIGAGLDRTGVMQHIAARILKSGSQSAKRLNAVVSGTAGMISGFMQNVGAAALFIPVVSRVSNQTSISMSRMLMPMGFCAILGGTLTMVGSSPLIMLNDLIANSNRSLPQGVDTIEPFSLFSVTPIGMALLATGLIYFYVFGKKVLPDRKTPGATRATTADYFEETYGIRGDIFELLVTADSPLVGMTIGDMEKLPDTPFILAIRTSDQARLAPPRDDTVWVGTILGVMGTRDAVDAFAEKHQLNVRPTLRNIGHLFNPNHAGICEFVVHPRSPLVGKTLGEERMRRQFGTSVLAINRTGGVIIDDVRVVPLQAGDTLVVHGTWKDMVELARDRNFVAVSDMPREQARPHKIVHALICFAAALALIVFTDFPLSVALLVGAVGMLLLGVLNMDEAYLAVSWKTVFLLASLIPLGYAMEITGTAAWIAQELLDALGTVPIWVLQVALAVLTTFFSLVMSNVGATVLLVPLAINLAIAIGADPAMFALIVALSTSNAFLIPTHQVNALIMGPGNYRVSDFLRAGGIMTVLFLVVMLLTVNALF